MHGSYVRAVDNHLLVAAPVLVLLPPRCVHHDSAGDGHGQLTCFRLHRSRKPIFRLQTDGLLDGGDRRSRIHRVGSPYVHLGDESHALGMTFMVSTMMIALPFSAVKVFNWIGTMWGGQFAIQRRCMLNAVVLRLDVHCRCGLSGIFMAAVPVDIYIHDTYFIVAHFHYVLFAGTAMAVFGAIYFWFPKMFGRMMDETLGKVHFFLTFLFLNGTFFTMHILGVVGFPRRLADPYHYETFKHLLPMNQFMTICAIGMVAVQVVFAWNFITSIFVGKSVGRNPWGANSLEWMAPSPPGHGNFDFQPIVYRGPYEYGSPESDKDYYPQTQPPPDASTEEQDGSADT